jgi:phage shock protein PspC (stress-responsive transcriptional regulator)
MQNKRLTRSETNKMIGGVCAGLGNYFSIDPTVVRLIFAGLVVFFGQGLLLYLILWIVMPVEETGSPAAPRYTPPATPTTTQPTPPQEPIPPADDFSNPGL